MRYPAKVVVTPELFIAVVESGLNEPWRNTLKADPCCYCGVLSEPSKSTVEHVVPRSKNGLFGWSNTSGCCIFCNRVKDRNDLLYFLVHFRKILDNRRANVWRSLSRSQDQSMGRSPSVNGTMSSREMQPEATSDPTGVIVAENVSHVPTPSPGL